MFYDCMTQTMFLRVLLLAVACFLSVDCHNILVVFPTPSHSHATLGRGIVRALTKHSPTTKVTFITPFPQKSPPKRVTEIDISELRPLADVLNMADEKVAQSMTVVTEFAQNITRMMMESPAVQQVVQKNRYDAVVTEWFFSDSYAGFAATLECPWIVVGGTVMHPHLEFLIDTISSPAVIPMMTKTFPIPMSFWQRIKNTFVVYLMTFTMQFQDYYTALDEYHRYFGHLAEARGVRLPEFGDALNNASLLLVNSHPSMSYAQALPPNAIEIGGYHIDEETPKLPENLQKLLDQAKEGVVYFSMGSVLKASKFPLAMRKELLQVLGELPYTVLWKFEEDMQDLPKNVHIMKFVPQQSVLAHPNVRVFITHGGLLSMLEAVHFGVPLLVVPVFGDQPANADRATRLGFALQVPFNDDVAKGLKVGLKEILENKSYYNKAQELSKLFRTRPVTPSQLISHYVELVIESKGALHLRPKARLYPFYQRYLLDQLALVVGVIAILFCAFKKTVKLCKSNKTQKKKAKKQ